MLDMVGNPEDRFSHNEAHLQLATLFVFQANPNQPSKQQKCTGKYQPSDKVLRKYVDKINVGM